MVDKTGLCVPTQAPGPHYSAACAWRGLHTGTVPVTEAETANADSVSGLTATPDGESMKTVITIRRTDEWVKAKRLETGDNTPKEIQVEVDVATLSPDTRLFLLQTGRYSEFCKEYKDFPYDAEFVFTPTGWGGKGSDKPIINSDNPTPAEIDAAIVDMQKRVAQASIENEEKIRKAIEEAAAAEERKKAAEAERQKARELLADDLQKITRLANELAEANEKIAVLSELVSEIPADAFRGTLKKMAAQRGRVAYKEVWRDVDASCERVLPASINDDEEDEE